MKIRLVKLNESQNKPNKRSTIGTIKEENYMKLAYINEDSIDRRDGYTIHTYEKNGFTASVSIDDSDGSMYRGRIEGDVPRSGVTTGFNLSDGPFYVNISATGALTSDELKEFKSVFDKASGAVLHFNDKVSLLLK